MAIFKRKNGQTPKEKLQSSLWPAMGWPRTFTYYKHRIFRQDQTSHQITSGLATGMAISWTPFYGFHIISALCISHLLKFNLFAALAGTLWGNPWTFPVMLWLNYHLGLFITGLIGLDIVGDFAMLLAEINFTKEPLLFMKTLFKHPFHVLLPVTIGGIINGLLFWPCIYAICYKPVSYIHAKYKAKRTKRIQRRQHKQDKKSL